jgi:hypothetical protein
MVKGPARRSGSIVWRFVGVMETLNFRRREYAGRPVGGSAAPLTRLPRNRRLRSIIPSPEKRRAGACLDPACCAAAS